MYTHDHVKMTHLTPDRNIPSHPNVRWIKCHDDRTDMIQVVRFVAFSPRPFALITEYLPMGNLESYVKKNKNLEFAFRLKLLVDVAAGMAHLSKQQVSVKMTHSMNVRLT